MARVEQNISFFRAVIKNKKLYATEETHTYTLKYELGIFCAHPFRIVGLVE